MATLREIFQNIADAIRSKGVSGTFTPNEMAQKIGEIQTGGGSEGGGEGSGGGEDHGYLTFTAQTSTTLTLRQNGSIAPHKLLKSSDGVTWTKWENPATNGISLNAGQSVCIKADENALQGTTNGQYNHNSFSSTGRINCSGDIRSIVNQIIPANYNYWLCDLFSDCTSLVSAPELPTTGATIYCYYEMFYNCTSLTTAPSILPATTLANNCYAYMFSYCTSLTTAPELPATTLASDCYSYMFSGCTSLKRVKMNASSGSWGNYMFYNCNSLELVDMTGSTAVPTLSNINNFPSANSNYKIVVPDSLYSTWIAATNWSSVLVKSHIMKKSDWNAAHPNDQL